MPSARIQWIDFCRVWTAFFVVLRHVDRPYGSFNYIIDLFNYRSLIFFFFLAAGYFTHKAAAGQWLDWKRTRTLLVPFVFWTAVASILLLQPMMQEIKQRCGDDRQRASMEMMALYRKYNISPLGGCLPMLLQIPIFFAFFYVLQTAAELRGAEFIFWVTDLSQPDTVCHIFGLPLNILPFVMAASMVAMMKMSPSAGDPMQQKIMKFMPVVFFLFCYTYPSALAPYWTTTNIISIIQTLIIRRLPQPTLEEAQANAKGKQKEGFFARIQRMAEEQQRQLEQQKRQGTMRNVTKKK